MGLEERMAKLLREVEQIGQRLDDFHQRLLGQKEKLYKEVLTPEEAAEFTGLSKSHIYHLTSTGEIPCYRPTGRRVFFNREELKKWLLRNRNRTAEELEAEAATATLKKGGAK